MQANLKGQEFTAQGIRTELPIIQRAIADLQACRTGTDVAGNINDALLPLLNPYVLQVEDDALVRLSNNDDFLKYQSSQQRDALFTLSRSIKYSKVLESNYQVNLRESYKVGVSALHFGAVSIESLDAYVDFIVEETPLSNPYHRSIVLPENLADLCGDSAFLRWLYDWETHVLFLAVSEGRLTRVLERALNALDQPMITSSKTTP